MWLLSTDRAELKFFNYPEDVEEGYAILSHVWDEEETTFQEVQSLRTECAKKGVIPRESPDIGYKIRESCRLAERHGWKWIWIDTCCIDKTSSAELSEAINSMFRYYSLSGVCYAFLRDVSSLDGVSEGTPDDMEWLGALTRSELARSRWHHRGWTLQELLAPQFLIFISSSWAVLGDKIALASALEYITSIPKAVLRFEKDIADISVAQRMSWAAVRLTTRVEDQAYSLMGIFGVNMPTLYGEGRMAFYRLQEEIMKTSTDSSLFSWGTPDDYPHRSAQEFRYQLNSEEPENQYLLAPSPAQFEFCMGRGIVDFNKDTGQHFNLVDPVGGEHSRAREELSMEHASTPTFSVTPRGIRARLPVLAHSSNGTTAYLSLLFCTEGGEGLPYYLALILLPSNEDSDAYPTVYRCGCIKYGRRRLVRVPSPGVKTRRKELLAPWTWTTLYIAARPPFRADVHAEHQRSPLVHRALRFTNTTNSIPFRIPPKCFAIGPFYCSHITPTPLPYNWTGIPSLTMFFKEESPRDASHLVAFSVCLGVCQNAALAHWAHFHLGDIEDHHMNICDTHSCAQDHISAWEGGSKTLRVLGDWSNPFYQCVTLKFTVCPMNETAQTLVVHLSSHPTQWRSNE